MVEEPLRLFEHPESSWRLWWKKMKAVRKAWLGGENDIDLEDPKL
jgi:hypothetical protein